MRWSEHNFLITTYNVYCYKKTIDHIPFRVRRTRDEC